MFSVKNRRNRIDNLLNEEIDLIIIGGGITGAGIALDAAQRGMKVVLFEKRDFASGTSSKSTKLVHGGLRYLKQLEFSLVREVGLERKIVHTNARHIVVAEKMLLPIIKNGSLNKFFTNIALYVYDFLAGVDKNERRKMLDKEKTIKEEPLLKSKDKNLIGGGLYYEYRTDDARLTIETLKKAVSFGAKCYNYIEVEEFINDDNKVTGVKIYDKISKQKKEIFSKEIVNASGPWVDLLRKKDKSLEGKRLLLTKGIHLVIKHKYLPINHAIYFDTTDDRMIFAIPRQGKTYIGTSDTVYNKDIDNIRVAKEDVKYILKAVNKMFTSLKLEENHIESSWAGLRPLIYEDGKSASEVSRKDEIFLSNSGLITIAGGKLTGYRKMAEKTVDIVRLRLKEKGYNYTHCNTEKTKLSGGEFDNNQQITDLIIQLTGEAKQIKLEMRHLKEWVYRYGSNAPQLLEIAYDLFKQIKDDSNKLMIITELIYCIENESIYNISDFLIRRTSRLYFDKTKVKEYLEDLLLELSTILNLNKEEVDIQREEFLIKYNNTKEFI